MTLSHLTDEYNDWTKKINEGLERFDFALHSFIEQLESDEEYATFEKEATALNLEVTNAKRQLMAAIAKKTEEAKSEAADDTVHAAPPSGEAGLVLSPRSNKANTTLKPFVLSLDHSMWDFLTWKAQFKSYYETSGFSEHSTQTQHMYLHGVLDSTIVQRVKPNISENTSIFGTGGVMDMITAIFEELHPLFSRRLDLFRYTQQPQQSTTDFLARLEVMFANAQISEMTNDEMLVQFALVGVQERKIRDIYFLETDDLTYEKMKKLDTKYSRRDRMVQKQTDTSHINFTRDGKEVQRSRPRNREPRGRSQSSTSRRRSPSRNRRSSSRGESRRDKDSRRRDSSSERPKSEGKHGASDCKDCENRRKAMVCHNCKKKGHIAKFCKARDNSKTDHCKKKAQ